MKDAAVLPVPQQPFLAELTVPADLAYLSAIEVEDW